MQSSRKSMGGGSPLGGSSDVSISIRYLCFVSQDVQFVLLVGFQCMNVHNEHTRKEKTEAVETLHAEIEHSRS